MWTANENDVVGAVDVHDVIAWADEEARERSSKYALYAVIKTSRGEGMIWLAGYDPTVDAERNFSRQQPPDVNPVQSF